jgi:hypothetical protein
VRNRLHQVPGHIKPWKDCTNEEPLDGENGLLLAPHIVLFEINGSTFEEELSV